MAVVGFDTATADTAVCVLRGDDVVHEELLGLAPDGSPRHSTALLTEVERAVGVAGGWERDRADRGRARPWARSPACGSASPRRAGWRPAPACRRLGVCTLDALGRGIGAAGSGARLAVLDARRGEAFAALYAASGERLWDPFVAAPAELADRVASLPEPPLAAGSGAVRFRDELASRGAEVPDDADPVHHVAARHICALAAAVEDEGGGQLDPIYIRPPDAQRWRERDTSQRAE